MLKAKSMEGALLQLAIASSIFDALASAAELAAEEDGAEKYRWKTRCEHSIGCSIASPIF
jgi:hypothetical protein